MKLFAMAIFFSFITPFASATEALDKEITLANTHDFVILSDVEGPEITIFLSYTGRQFNHCGIFVAGHSFAVDFKKLHQRIQVDDAQGPQDIGELAESGLVAKVDPNDTSFGKFFRIKSRDGRPLKTAIEESGRGFRRAELIAKIRPCEESPTQR
ncbi:MAG: hypothetical protein AB7F86_15040 [Bdellovibrionales bacterium]